MDFKKYLVVLIFFVVGVFIGKMLPTNTAVDNTAATSRTQQPSVTQPVVNTNSYNRAVTTPDANTDLRGGGAGVVAPSSNDLRGGGGAVVAPTEPNFRTQNNPTRSYVGISSLSKNLYRGNIFNDTEQVKSLQRFLVAEKFLEGTPDGRFGPMTQGAVMKFQAVYKISPSAGYVGPMTRDYINKIIGNSFGSVSQPTGVNERPFVVCENGGGPGPAGFSAWYTGSSPAGSTFVSMMGSTPYNCTVY